MLKVFIILVTLGANGVEVKRDQLMEQISMSSCDKLATFFNEFRNTLNSYYTCSEEEQTYINIPKGNKDGKTGWEKFLSAGRETTKDFHGDN